MKQKGNHHLACVPIDGLPKKRKLKDPTTKSIEHISALDQEVAQTHKQHKSGARHGLHHNKNLKQRQWHNWTIRTNHTMEKKRVMDPSEL